MKAGHLLGAFLISGATLVLFSDTTKAQPIPLAIRPAGGQVELSWPAAMTNGSQGMVFPNYEVQASTDLVHWAPLGAMLRGIDGRFGPRLSLLVDKEAAPKFYRVRAALSFRMPPQLADGGAEVFGYNSQFAPELAKLGQLSLADFATNGPHAAYLPQLSWDPTTAQYWTNFYTTNLWRAHYGSDVFGTNLLYNFRLNDQELAIFRTNGFVVSERLGSATFGDAYYRVFNADLPVFISADAVLQAWHYSYQNILQELEYAGMSRLLDQILNGLSGRLSQVWQQYNQGPLHDSILDADYFLTVARSLSAGQQVASGLGDAGVVQQVAATLQAIQSQTTQTIPIFGAYRVIDFSQFKVRGHYDANDQLRRYFQAMMWCARIDLRLATFWPNQEDDLRQLGTATVLDYLALVSGQRYNWWRFERITRAFFGVADSMTLGELDSLLLAGNILTDWPDDWALEVPDRLALTNLQTRLLTGELGVQNIAGSLSFSPLGPAQVKLPRSFALSGQIFALDSWVFSQTVFDRVLREPSDGVGVLFGKVIRRKPSALDAAFAVLGNDQVVPELVARMTNSNGVPFRDGRPYQHNLLAVRRVIDRQDPAVWTDNLYTGWLAALRALSAPTTNAAYPEAMRTRAWAMKTLNAQLASWTELRHDTVLYAKESYSDVVLCSYPAGFVEPRPEFWQKMKDLANLAAGTVDALAPYFSWDSGTKARESAFLSNFTAQVSTLQGIAQKELGQQPLTFAESDFLKNTIERYLDYTGVRRWNGWYPQLFYTNALPAPLDRWGSPSRSTPGCDKWDPPVVSVHTDPPDEVVGDPGAIIHEAVGHVPLLLIAVDNGPDRMVFAGPVLSHYEFEEPMNSRLSDTEWKDRLKSQQAPAPPEWTRSYFVPGGFVMPPGYP